MNEQIQLKKSRSGTTITFFSTQKLEDYDIYPSYVILDANNNQSSIHPLDEKNGIWTLNNRNNNIPLIANIITGYSFVQTTEYTMSLEDMNKTNSSFKQKVQEEYPNSTNYVFFKSTYIDDYFVNIKLNRTFATLDTLNIYNNALNSFPTQEATTGVVFGKLEALQKINDGDGNKVRIPLKNVKIGIFNSSEVFPSSTSVDDDGDRITLNLKEASKKNEYFNIESYSADTEFLKSSSEFESIPDQYKYITTTNDKGEFIIANVPSGEQILIFEVDLLKQGLTHDEVALNFFPYPTDVDPNIDTIPHFFFRQIPIDVIPAWGTLQSGYTEVNISVNLDLRKWSTFYIPPVAYGDKTYEENTAKGITNPITIEIRDMSKEGYPLNTQSVQIVETLDRVENQQLEWVNEFAQHTGKLQFRKYDMSIFKVPANMYDPEGFKTDKEGASMQNQKGVWLAGYQIKLSYVNNDVFRTTGHHWDWYKDVKPYNQGFISRDHFHLNRNIDTSTFEKDIIAAKKGIGIPPYDKPWSHLYPDKYKIPKKPTQQNPNWHKTLDVAGQKVYLDEPKYLDGDLIGEGLWKGSGLKAAGFGTQDFDGSWIGNRFAETVTKNFVYKYEANVSTEEMYANGYQPSCTWCPTNKEFENISHVENGEKYQRVECGYGYFLKPWGWSRVSQYGWGDTLYKKDIEITNDNPKDSSWYIFTSINEYFPLSMTKFEEKRDDLALKMDKDATIYTGGLDIYRIIDSSPNNLLAPAPLVLNSQATFYFQKFYYQRGSLENQLLKIAKNNTKNGAYQDMFADSSSNPSVSLPSSEIQMSVINNGEIEVTIENVTIGGREEGFFSSQFLNEFQNINGLALTLPGNYDYNEEKNRYDKANYTIKFNPIQLSKGNSNRAGETKEIILNINLPVVNANETRNYYLVTEINNIRTNYNPNKKNKCRDNLQGSGAATVGTKKDHNIKANGLFFISKDNYYYNIFTGALLPQASFRRAYFQSSGISPTCGEKHISSDIYTIPFQVI